MEATGAGDSVRSTLAFFFLEDLDSVGTGGFWRLGEAILIVGRSVALVLTVNFEIELSSGDRLFWVLVRAHAMSQQWGSGGGSGDSAAKIKQ